VIGGAKANWLFTTAATALIWRGGQYKTKPALFQIANPSRDDVRKVRLQTTSEQ